MTVGLARFCSFREKVGRYWDVRVCSFSKNGTQGAKKQKAGLIPEYPHCYRQNSCNALFPRIADFIAGGNGRVRGDGATAGVGQLLIAPLNPPATAVALHFHGSTGRCIPQASTQDLKGTLATEP